MNILKGPRACGIKLLFIMKREDGEKYCLFVIDVLYSHLNKTDQIFELDNISLE